MEKKKYWYYSTITECVLCGTSDIIKERMYTSRPLDINKRYNYVQTACDSHFM